MENPLPMRPSKVQLLSWENRELCSSRHKRIDKKRSSFNKGTKILLLTVIDHLDNDELLHFCQMVEISSF